MLSRVLLSRWVRSRLKAKAAAEAQQRRQEATEAFSNQNMNSIQATVTRFIEQLPSERHPDSIDDEPDGYIGLEWYRSPRCIITVSVGPENTLIWAALIGSDAYHGSSTCYQVIPPELLRLIERVTEGR